jgi:predicted outer membrane repeat protein
MRRRRFSIGTAVAGLAAATVVLAGAGPAGAATTWTVNCPGGDLQGRIDGASSGDTIVVYGTCYGNFTIDNKNLTLQGGSAGATLNGRGSGTTLTIENSVDTRIDNLTITNGSATYGGGIHDEEASLTLANVTIRDNRADFGGGMWARFAYTVDMTGVTVTRNTAGSNGGGIFVLASQLSMTASTVSKNRSRTSVDGGGGGIWAEDANVLLTSTKVTTNTSADYGGGIAAYGGSFRGGASPIPGTSPFTNGLLDAGVMLVSSTVDHNIAADDGGGVYNASQEGDSPLVLQGSTVSFNSALSGDGGGIANYGRCGHTASMLVTKSTFQGNLATHGDGGAIYNATGTPCPDSGTALLTIAQSPVANGPSVVNSNQARHGGGIANEQDEGVASVSLQPGATVRGNKASVTGGGVWNNCGSFSSLGQIFLNTPNNVVSTCIPLS